MKIVMLSTDPMILQESTARERMKAYGALGEELHIIVIGKPVKDIGKDIQQIAQNVWLHPALSGSRVFALLKAVTIGTKLVKTFGADGVISAQDPFEQGLAGFTISLLTGTHLQLQVHTDFLSPYFAKQSTLNSIRVFIAKILLPKVEGIRVVSERIRKSLVEQLGLREIPIVVLPIYVEKSAPAAGPASQNSSSQTETSADLLHTRYPQFDFIALMASRLTPEKDIQTGIKAFASFAKQQPKAGLVIAGRGPEEQRLKSLVAELNLQSQIVFEVWQPLGPLLKSADVFLLTSKFEGYGLTLIEAALAGCPIISTDVGIAPDIIQDGVNGYIVPVGDRELLADALSNAASNSQTLKQQALKRAEKVRATLPAWDAYIGLYKKSLEITTY